MVARGASLRILALNWRCIRHPQAGGSEKNLFEQARHWARSGHAVTIFCADPGRRYAPLRDETIDGVRVVRRGGRLSVYPRAALELLRRGDGYDCVLDVANGIPFFAPLFCRQPVVLLVHHVHDRQWFSEFPRWAARVGRYLEGRVVPLLYARRPVIAVSPSTRDMLARLGFERAQVRVVYNGVEHPPALSRQNRPDACRIAYIGRLKRYKRLPRLIEAVAALRSEFPELHLDIAGDGDARPELEGLIRRLGLEDHVTLHGFVDEGAKSRILASATVFATPSMHEGWGLSVIEANAHGCPAVAYDVPGLRVAIRHGETGLLASDDAAFREAIARLLRDRALREEYAARAVRWARKFDWETCALHTLSVLRESTVAGSPRFPVDEAAWPRSFDG